jgi:hypothetical protein
MGYDGSPTVQVQSDGNVKPLAPDGYASTVHRFGKPGDYLVRVERTNRRGLKATTRLHVRAEHWPLCQITIKGGTIGRRNAPRKGGRCRT